MKKQVEKLLGLIREITDNTGHNWQEKRDLILAECGEAEKTALEEFVSWFDEPAKVEHHGIASGQDGEAD